MPLTRPGQPAAVPTPPALARNAPQFLVNTAFHDLPYDLRAILNNFLGGDHRHYYVPSPIYKPAVRDVVQTLFRFPVGGLA